MSFSLAKLVEFLPLEAFKNLRREFPEEEKFKILCQKGVYPYDYMDSVEKLKETSLPPLERWYNKIEKRFPTEEEFTRAHKVWKIFGCKTMEDYMRIYQKADVLLLADVFEGFRELSLDSYNLDPAYFFTTPSLGISALMKTTGMEFPLFVEEQSEMYRLAENLIRGGVVNCPMRYAEANNKYMENYDPTKPSSFIKNMDKNSLYAGIMADCPLPDGNFEWINEEELRGWRLFLDEEGVGCILVVDLEYPWELHDYHNEFPLAVEKGKKLIPNLRDKKFYPAHYKNLECYTKYGLKITKIHYGLKFTESCWMRPYIMLNIEKRKNAKNDFEKEFRKLMNNAPFGQTMENVRNRVDIVPGLDKNFCKLVQRPAFKNRKILSENLSLIHFKRLEIRMNKPIILGACILELSKVEMIEEYFALKEKYGKKMNLLYTDTDSLFPYILTEDWYQDIKEEVKEKYDTSNISENHKAKEIEFPIGDNKK